MGRRDDRRFCPMGWGYIGGVTSTRALPVGSFRCRAGWFLAFLSRRRVGLIPRTILLREQVADLAEGIDSAKMNHQSSLATTDADVDFGAESAAQFICDGFAIGL